MVSWFGKAGGQGRPVALHQRGGYVGINRSIVSITRKTSTANLGQSNEKLSFAIIIIM